MDLRFRLKCLVFKMIFQKIYLIVDKVRQSFRYLCFAAFYKDLFRLNSKDHNNLTRTRKLTKREAQSMIDNNLKI